MTKRIFVILLTCLLTVSFVPSILAFADAIFVPENDFYERHKSECIPVEQVFRISGEEGVSLKQKPGSEIEVVIDEDEVKWIIDHGYHVLCVYNYKGKPWGYVEHVSYDGNFSGWLLLDQTVRAEDEVLFSYDHRDSVYDYPGSDEDILKKLETVDKLVFWRWPYSGARALGWGGLICKVDNVEDIRALGNYSFSKAFRDEAGREWVCFSNDWKVGWICLDDPENENMPELMDSKPWPWNVSEPDPMSQPQELVSNPQSVQQRPLSSPVLIIVLVSAVVLGSAALILMFWKPNKKKQEATQNTPGGEDENEPLP